MTDEAKWIVEMLREGACCNVCNIAHPTIDRPFPCEERVRTCDNMDKAADLIESLSAKLEKVERERDAAVEDFTEAMKHSESCIFCKHLNVIDDDGGCDMPKILPGESCWQWRGTKE